MKLKLPVMFLACFLMVGLLICQEEEDSYWWQVRIEASVSGNYHYSKINKGFSGDYAFTALIVEAFEQDSDGDFILYHGYCQVSNVIWIESNGSNNQIKKKRSSDGRVKIEPRLNYLIRKGDEVVFNFDIESVQIAGEKNKKSLELILPRSAENGCTNRKDHYNRYVIDGSNDISIKQKKISNERDVVKRFQWTWKCQNPDLSNHHIVKIKLMISRQ